MKLTEYLLDKSVEDKSEDSAEAEDSEFPKS
jgi:hypothetical protein